MSKSYFISGGNRGIGFALVKMLSSDASNTVVAGVRNVEGATELQEWANSHTNVKIVSLDVSVAESHEEAAKETARILPDGLDVLIANAGIGKASEPILDISDDSYYEHFTVNTLGPIRLLRAFKSLLDKKSTKHFAVVSSVAGSLVRNIDFPISTSSYGLSKAGINFAIINLNRELGPQGYKVVAIHPGLVSSDMGIKGINNKNFKGLIKDIVEKFPPITPEESAEDIKKNILEKLPELAGKFISHDGSEVPW
ncbi:LAFA_0G20032g1_1 [Lachancea sp. 'fantastica']|nr:LAFA_0G20032g1_1 [Lachancea sp. 'fantastica']